jgi:hypothetical protein
MHEPKSVQMFAAMCTCFGCETYIIPLDDSCYRAGWQMHVLKYMQMFAAMH